MLRSTCYRAFSLREFCFTAWSCFTNSRPESPFNSGMFGLRLYWEPFFFSLGKTYSVGIWAHSRTSMRFTEYSEQSWDCCFGSITPASFFCLGVASQRQRMPPRKPKANTGRTQYSIGFQPLSGALRLMRECNRLQAG